MNRLNNLGAVVGAARDVPRARNYWTRALHLRKDLRAESPSDVAARRDEAVSFANLGGLELGENRLDAAESAFRKAVAPHVAPTHVA